MFKKSIVTCLFIAIPILLHCQSNDSVQLHEVSINSYLSNRPLLRLPSSASQIDQNELKKQNGQSLVPVINTVPGVRMEERSPGSYRLSIRGSLLRSPFGIRNVKIYLDEFPLTDASGNTYLNLLDINAIHSIEILKGPDGSLFGANSGGVIRLNMLPMDTINEIKAGIGAGSYGLFNEYSSIRQKLGKNTFELMEGWQHAEGYRENSKLDRKYVQLTDQFQYASHAKLKLLLFYSNLYYQTPGGLTLQQWTNTPDIARPSGPVTPGAKEQQAAVYNATVYAGISNEIQLNKTWSNTTALTGSYTDFKNPFITNYEVRRENTIGVRTWFQASNNKEGETLVKYHLGAEASRTHSDIKNYDNNLGYTGNPQKFDILSNNQLFIFNHLLVDFHNKWLIEGGVSLNFTAYSFHTTLPYQQVKGERSFIPQLMPKIAASYQLARLVALRASVSRGFSAPTLAEIRSSNNEINTSLQPENGWNYELGLRFRSKNNLIWWDVCAFYYLLNDAIVRRVNESAQEYFVNAGGTKQAGLESQVMLQLIKDRNRKLIQGLNLNNSLTYSNFKFTNYAINSNSYSGNKLTGVPSYAVVSGLTLKLPVQLYLFFQHTYTSAIFLDDANSISANAYNVFLLKGGWRFTHSSRFDVEFSVGADNLFNEKYSLGNDLNAMGGRYFNAAMPRNYFCKLELTF